jgi:hypothetical protein
MGRTAIVHSFKLIQEIHKIFGIYTKNWAKNIKTEALLLISHTAPISCE